MDKIEETIGDAAPRPAGMAARPMAGPAFARRAIGLLFLVGLAVAVPASAQQAGAPDLKTLKERLGAKWTDEQRVDNCKVPLDKRGPKPRPDACPNPAAFSAKRP